MYMGKKMEKSYPHLDLLSLRTFSFKEKTALKWSIRQSQKPVIEPIEVTINTSSTTEN